MVGVQVTENLDSKGYFGIAGDGGAPSGRSPNPTLDHRVRSSNFDLTVARVHASLWANLAKRGTVVGERDLMISATAVAMDHGIATRHERSFPKIPGLRVQRLWTDKSENEGASQYPAAGPACRRYVGGVGSKVKDETVGSKGSGYVKPLFYGLFWTSLGCLSAGRPPNSILDQRVRSSNP
jgi:hypothetical protein